LRTYVELSRQAADNDLTIWPETAIPAFYEDVEEDFIQFLMEQANRTRTDYLIGIPAGSWDTGIFYNAVVGLGSDHGFYYKRRLVPFGEYLPLRSLLDFFHDWVDIPMADFTPGAEDQPPLLLAGHPIAVSICFEVAFGREIRKGLPEVQLLVNVSNDAWFGDSLAPHQHLEIARMRALEAGRPMARATNTGISALIDARGRIIARSEQFVPQVLEESPAAAISSSSTRRAERSTPSKRSVNSRTASSPRERTSARMSRTDSTTVSSTESDDSSASFR
jgi:apolipoprotein N-acyltransferase